MSGSNGNGRRFEDKPAVREQVPLLVGLMGASGSGKTFSALRLASGIAKVDGRPVFVIDTEARRALHYADRFDFRHVQFGEPFGPLDYLAAIDHCVEQGAGTIVIDSMSHEHEGAGGILEMHEQELDRIAGNDFKKRERVKMLAWARPKKERRRLINSILQRKVNFISCFRAKEKLKVERGKEPVPMGFMPIAGEEFVYEQTVNCLLMPNSGGVPTWQSDEQGERKMMKLPEQFRSLFRESRPLDESTGEALAKWAAGDMSAEDARAEKARTWLANNLPNATTEDQLQALEAKIKKAPKSVRDELQGKVATRRKELNGEPGASDEPDEADLPLPPDPAEEAAE